jgi:hypothetical protein
VHGVSENLGGPADFMDETVDLVHRCHVLEHVNAQIVGQSFEIGLNLEAVR